MGVSTTYLSKAEIQDLLGITSIGMWRLPQQHQNFPAPERHPHRNAFDADTDAGQIWDGTAVYEWAAETPQFRHRGAVLARPLPAQRGPGQHLGYRDTPLGPASDWHTAIGVIRMLHTTERGAASAMATELATERNHEITTVCALYGDIGYSGPALVAADTAQPSIEYEASWGTAVALAGQPLPWWPGLLRRPAVIRMWSPGAPAVTADLPADDRETALRLAAHTPGFSVEARAVLTDMANVIRNQRVGKVEMEIEIFGKQRPGLSPTPIIIAAKHVATAHPIDVLEDNDLRRAGWREIARSSQPDAVAATHIALGWDSTLLPYGRFTDVRAMDNTIVEWWTRRLTMCDPTAAHATLAEGKAVKAFFTDPLTDMPAVRTKDDGDNRAKWLFYAPLSLPAGRGELASVVLDGTVWITTADGQVHPAPCTPNEHLWWGDGWGDRPTEAAHVVNLLLDNLSAPITLRNHWQDAPAGLTALFSEEHKPGTELTRATLLRARTRPSVGRR
ncbi:hypothetical protein OHV05_35975 (plasmid) [Kitasatospora sp. NBC_00070]|uniref:hypothetical protein n=1 Tax=Kitasatospora sp. NBC_00070 TaxID=2975962 RepID=UPI002F917350